jgi:hypothetical protein
MGADNPMDAEIASPRQTPVAYADATDNPCPKCGDDIVVAYAGLRPRFVAVRCFEGHFLGWARWPETQGGFNS